jgi:SAM-dependent methyltransferase
MEKSLTEAISMLVNYETDRNGVIKQIHRERFVYDLDYTVARYDAKKVPVDNMSYLRLGYLLSSLGKIPKSLLDVGYGNGNFLYKAKQIIKNCYGYDISPQYPIVDIPVVKDIYSDAYDVVCFFDSLEHFEDIYEIKKLKANYIYISVPWCHYLDDKWFRDWRHRREHEHLWHFDINSLKNFMSEMNYEYMCHANVEDAIRKSYDDNLENILTAIFKKC